MKTKNIISFNNKLACLCQAKYIAGRYNVNRWLPFVRKDKKIITKPPITTSNRIKDLEQRLQAVSVSTLNWLDTELKVYRSLVILVWKLLAHGWRTLTTFW